MLTNYPEDSVLKRHALSAEYFKRAEAVNMIPTDSILLRHYLQRNAAGTITTDTVTADQLVDAVATIDHSQPDYPDKPKRTGLPGFLARLFGL